MMTEALQSAGKLIAKTVAIRLGKALVKPKNLKKMGKGVGLLAAAGAGYMIFKAVRKK